MNSTAAAEWLRIACHDLKSAQILFNAEHFTDSIGCDLQQAIEKTLKAVIASKNQKIPKSHDLYEVFVMLKEIDLSSDQVDMLYLATEYYKEERYPNPNYALPSREEISQVMAFAEALFFQICEKLGIDPEGLEGYIGP